MRLRYRTYEFDQQDVHVCTLRSLQEYDDPQLEAQRVGISPANWALFGVVWESSEVLARLMWRRSLQGQRILEVGCGIGLASLVLALRRQPVSATDRHPMAKAFLDYNSMLNGLPAIRFERCGWDQPSTPLGAFDLIIGSDLLYEEFMLEPLSGFIARHARRPCEVLLVDPDRGLRNKFAQHMRHHGFSEESSPAPPSNAPNGYRGTVLCYTRMTN